MDNFIYIFDTKFEYDFLSGWIKYNRIIKGISQEALSHGICSPSHLSCFENGKKKLRRELIEALLLKLNIKSIIQINNIGLIRQKFHKLMFEIEGFDYESAELTYKEILELESLLRVSPYNIEYSIYTLMYKVLVERKSPKELRSSIELLDKIYITLNPNLKYLYMLVTGKHLFHSLNHEEGIQRFEEAFKIKETPWINYRLGVAYNENLEYLKSIVFLEKALTNYSLYGNYRNALECHSFLGSSYTELKMYDKAEFHLSSVLNGSNYFTLDKNYFSVYTNLAKLYLKMNKYDKCLSYCELAMSISTESSSSKHWLKSSWHKNEQPMIAACIYVEANKKINSISKCDKIFNKYRTTEYKDSIYYNYLLCLHLSIYIFDDKFYSQVTKNIIPFYNRLGYLNISYKITLLLIEFLEKNRRYKEATVLYKQIINE